MLAGGISARGGSDIFETMWWTQCIRQVEIFQKSRARQTLEFVRPRRGSPPQSLIFRLSQLRFAHLEYCTAHHRLFSYSTTHPSSLCRCHRLTRGNRTDSGKEDTCFTDTVCSRDRIPQLLSNLSPTTPSKPPQPCLSRTQRRRRSSISPRSTRSGSPSPLARSLRWRRCALSSSSEPRRRSCA